MWSAMLLRSTTKHLIVISTCTRISNCHALHEPALHILPGSQASPAVNDPESFSPSWLCVLSSSSLSMTLPPPIMSGVCSHMRFQRALVTCVTDSQCYKLCTWLHLNGSSRLYPSPLWWWHYTSWHTIFLPVPTLSGPAPWKSLVFFYVTTVPRPLYYPSSLQTISANPSKEYKPVRLCPLPTAHCTPSDLQRPHLHSLRSGVAFTVISSTPARGLEIWSLSWRQRKTHWSSNKRMSRVSLPLCKWDCLNSQWWRAAVTQVDRSVPV